MTIRKILTMHFTVYMAKDWTIGSQSRLSTIDLNSLTLTKLFYYFHCYDIEIILIIDLYYLIASRLKYYISWYDSRKSITITCGYVSFKVLFSLKFQLKLIFSQKHLNLKLVIFLTIGSPKFESVLMKRVVETIIGHS